jgi:hypothetical protein
MDCMFMKILRFLVGLALLPVCVAATQTVILLVRDIQPSSTHAIPPSAWALGIGFFGWLVLWFTVPRPVRSYVLAHELTHALWGLIMGSKVSGLSVGKARGSVEVSDPNFLTTLAPYFFPLYTLLVCLAYYLLSLFFDVERYHLIWLGLVGLTWGFHLTFTATTLLQKQTDIQQYGFLLSYAFIYFMNVLGIGLWIVAVTSVTMEQFIRLTYTGTLAVLLQCRHSVETLARIWQ